MFLLCRLFSSFRNMHDLTVPRLVMYISGPPTSSSQWGEDMLLQVSNMVLSAPLSLVPAEDPVYCFVSLLGCHWYKRLLYSNSSSWKRLFKGLGGEEREKEGGCREPGGKRNIVPRRFQKPKSSLCDCPCRVLRRWQVRKIKWYGRKNNLY